MEVQQKPDSEIYIHSKILLTSSLLEWLTFAEKNEEPGYIRKRMRTNEGIIWNSHGGYFGFFRMRDTLIAHMVC